MGWRSNEGTHIHKHGIREEEVVDVLSNPGEDRPSREDSGLETGNNAGRPISAALFMFPIPNRRVYL